MREADILKSSTRYETCPELVEALSAAEGVIEIYEFYWSELQICCLIMECRIKKIGDCL